MRYDGQSISYCIHDAVSSKNVECVKALIEAGCKVDALHTNHGQSEYGSEDNLSVTHNTQF